MINIWPHLNFLPSPGFWADYGPGLVIRKCKYFSSRK